MRHLIDALSELTIGPSGRVPLGALQLNACFDLKSEGDQPDAYEGDVSFGNSNDTKGNDDAHHLNSFEEPWNQPAFEAKRRSA